MMKQSATRTCLSVVLATLVLLGISRVVYGQTVSISIPSLHIAGKERVVGFELHVKSGIIAQLRNVPIGWSLSVDNDPSWNTAIKGTAMVGAAAVDQSFFRDFLVLEKNESLGIPFNVEGEVVVTADFKAERRIKIGAKDCLMKAIPAKSPNLVK
jgi:hypothetical protein